MSSHVQGFQSFFNYFGQLSHQQHEDYFSMENETSFLFPYMEWLYLYELAVKAANFNE